ncbi:MAG: RNA polymerase sigma factor [Gemmataceae bacterium]
MHDLRRGGQTASAGIVTDAQLLERFVRGREESAFELLVWRHGAMVLGLCQRIVRDAQAAEDVFQATFLTLSLKAKSIQRGASLASWLYKVAFRLALRARASVEKHSIGEAIPLDSLAGPPRDEAEAADLRAALDEEIRTLPERYRGVFLLCCVEGKTQEEAARELGLPVGTVYSRLARAREKLRRRLDRRGIALAALALLFLETAEVSAHLVTHATAQSLALAGGAKAMLSPLVAALLAPVPRTTPLLMKALALLLVGALLLGGGYYVWANVDPTSAASGVSSGADSAAPPAACHTNP